jgi:FtsP/CotA-like multicopper oxidase with cupredoxin domain
MRLPAVILALTSAATLLAGPLTQLDRDRALSELQTSRQQFLDAIAGLTPAQWTYKAGPDRWSIAEVAEHIIAAEDYIGGLVTKKMMASPADTAKAEQRQPSNSKMDEGFLTGLRDRSKKANAPGEIVPKGIYKTPGDAADAFQAARGKTLEYVRTTNDALREHFATPFPGFEMDGVQGLLMIAGHNERHVLQMLEVKQAPGYPVSSAKQ